MRKTVSLVLIIGCFSVCLANKRFHFSCGVPAVDYFLSCYFNDLTGSIGFTAFADFMLHFCGRGLDKYWQILCLTISFGILWEVVTPMFRPSSVGDFFDVVAYVVGGSIYYGIQILTYRLSLKGKEE